MGYDLFNPPPDDSNPAQRVATKNDLSIIAPIYGLTYIPNYLSAQEHEELVQTIQRQPWRSDIRRRVQHYGWRYDYKVRSIDYDMYMGNLPDWVGWLAKQLYEDKHIGAVPDQMIVNEYLPGQGIAPHIDCEPCFGNAVISISLLSPIVMDFCHVATRRKAEVLLEPRSLVVIADESRYEWTHGIAARKTDFFRQEKFDRKLRISLTFRKVMFEKP